MISHFLVIKHKRKKEQRNMSTGWGVRHLKGLCMRLEAVDERGVEVWRAVAGAVGCLEVKRSGHRAGGLVLKVLQQMMFGN